MRINDCFRCRLHIGSQISGEPGDGQANHAASLICNNAGSCCHRGCMMTHFNDGGRWLRWLLLDHLLLIVVILMIAALLSTLYFRSVNQERLKDYELQRSVAAPL